MHITSAADGTPWPVVPFGTWRLWDAYVTWKDLEPSKGIWNFAKLDALVSLAAQHNVEIILPLALTPQWASGRPNEPSAYTPGAAAEPSSRLSSRLARLECAAAMRGRDSYVPPVSQT